MLILPKDSMRKQANEAREALTVHYNAEMERILNENQAKGTYWILGKVKFPPELGGSVGRAFLEASDVKPGLIKESFLYEVNNKAGTKALLWVMNPDGSLRLPTLGKTIQATPAKKGVIRA